MAKTGIADMRPTRIFLGRLPDALHWPIPVLLLLMSLPLKAQSPELQDTLPVVSYADKFIVKANFSTQTDAYLYRASETGDQLNIEPNSSLRLFLSLDYEFIGVSFGFSPGFFGGNADEDLKGKSDISDYRFRFFFGNWVQGLQYRNIRGYYVKNTADFIPGFRPGTDPYLQFPDLRSQTFGMSTAYVFNPRFSYRNVLYQTEWQKKSAGSFVPTFSYEYHRFSLKEPELNSEEKVINLKLSPSYFYTFVLQQHWFASASLAPALGIKFSNSRETNEGVFSKDSGTYFSQYLEGGVQLGYSSERVIFGGNLIFNANWYRDSTAASLENDQVFFLLYFGYRFNAPGFAAKGMDLINGR